MSNSQELILLGWYISLRNHGKVYVGHISFWVDKEWMIQCIIVMLLTAIVIYSFSRCYAHQDTYQKMDFTISACRDYFSYQHMRLKAVVHVCPSQDAFFFICFIYTCKHMQMYQYIIDEKRCNYLRKQVFNTLYISEEWLEGWKRSI